MNMCLCPHLVILVYISETMASLHARWLARPLVVFSSVSRPDQLLWHHWCYKHKSLSVDPHSIAWINPHISHTESASRLFVHSNWEAMQFVIWNQKTQWESFNIKILSRSTKGIYFRGKCVPVKVEYLMRWHGEIVKHFDPCLLQDHLCQNMHLTKS